MRNTLGPVAATARMTAVMCPGRPCCEACCCGWVIDLFLVRPVVVDVGSGCVPSPAKSYRRSEYPDVPQGSTENAQRFLGLPGGGMGRNPPGGRENHMAVLLSLQDPIGPPA